MQVQRKAKIVPTNYIRIGLAKESDLKNYTELLQRV
jgi:hypothetical protein